MLIDISYGFLIALFLNSIFRSPGDSNSGLRPKNLQKNLLRKGSFESPNLFRQGTSVLIVMIVNKLQIIPRKFVTIYFLSLLNFVSKMCIM